MADTITDVLTTLRDRRTALTSELQRIDNAIAALSALSPAPRITIRRAPGRQTRETGIKATIAKIVEEESPKALHADQVLRAVRARGLSVSAKDPKATIVTALLRLAAEREKHGGWGVWKLPRNTWIWSDHEPSGWELSGSYGADGEQRPLGTPSSVPPA